MPVGAAVKKGIGTDAPTAAQGGMKVRQPVVHCEVMGTDGERLRSYHAELFGWTIDADNPRGYGVVKREGNTNAAGEGIGGGVGASPPGYVGHLTFYVEVPDVEGSARAGRGAWRVAPYGGLTGSPARTSRSASCWTPTATWSGSCGRFRRNPKGREARRVSAHMKGPA
jgi:predicted enzyme related to lactoylglutathione lyase